MRISPVGSVNYPEKRNKALAPVLVGVTALSVLGALTLISKGKTGTGKIANFLKNAKIGGETLSAVEGFNMFKPKTYINLIKKMHYGPLDVVAMAGSSVASGLAVGCLLDGKNKKTKLKEAISQMVGNIIFPIACLTAANALMPKVSKPVKILSSLVGFAAGVIGGNKAANKINEVVFKTGKVPPRAVKVGDFSAHIDDGCATIGLVGKGVAICEKIARVIPAALTISGISTGLAKNEKQ
jgi:hypothetical protein